MDNLTIMPVSACPGACPSQNKAQNALLRQVRQVRQVYREYGYYKSLGGCLSRVSPVSQRAKRRFLGQVALKYRKTEDFNGNEALV